MVSLVLLVAAALLPFSGWLRLTAFLVPYILIGWDVLWKACLLYTSSRFYRVVKLIKTVAFLL